MHQIAKGGYMHPERVIATMLARRGSCCIRRPCRTAGHQMSAPVKHLLLHPEFRSNMPPMLTPTWQASLMGLCSPDLSTPSPATLIFCSGVFDALLKQSASISSHETINKTLASSLHRVNLPVNRRQALLLEEGIGLGEVLTSKEPLHSQPLHEQPTGIPRVMPKKASSGKSV